MLKTINNNKNDKDNNSKSWIFCISITLITVTWSFKNKKKIRNLRKMTKKINFVFETSSDCVLIKCERVKLSLFSLNILPNKKKIMHCCPTGKKNDTFKYWLLMSYFVQMVQTAILSHTQQCICKHDKWYLS